MATHDGGTLPPMTPPRPNAGAGIDWDRPVGYAHAAGLLALIGDRS